MNRLLVLFAFTTALAAADSWDRLTEISRKPPAEARTALEQLLLKEPGFTAARFNLGTLLLESDPTKAAEQLELATASDSAALVADAWYNLALARFKQGRLEEALADAERAATLDPRAAPLRDEIRRVALARRDEARRKAEEEARKLHLDPTPLPVGHVGESYQARLPIAGGTPPATATLAGSSHMPDGLTLSPDGAITGTPRTAGTTHLDLSLQDKAGAKITAATELRILPKPAITTEQLPEAILGQPYRTQLAAVGFAGVVRWDISTLPVGLTGSSDGTISGTPTVIGTSNVHIHAGDGTHTADRLIELVVSDSFAPAENPLPPATATAAYQHRVTIRGPAQSYRCSGGAGTPMHIASDGTVTGTPAQAGELIVPTTIAAADGRSREVMLTIPVNPVPLIQPEPIQLTVGTPVDQALKVSGGTAPFVWSTASGSLPAGVRLDADGHLRGVAKDPGNSTATVAVVDRWKADTQAEIQITVNPAQDPPPQDKKDQQDNKDQQDKQDQAKKDQQKQDKADQSKQDSQGQQGKDEQQKQDQQQADGKQAQAEKDEKKDQADQAAVLNQTAADRWLDQLPAESRDALRYQLLDGGQKKPKQNGKTW